MARRSLVGAIGPLALGCVLLHPGHAQAIPPGTYGYYGSMVIHHGPSDEKINRAVKDAIIRQEAAKEEVPLVTGLKKGDALQIRLITGEAKFGNWLVTLRVDRLEITDPGHGIFDCGVYANRQERFLYCKPKPEGGVQMTSAWEPYFVPDEPKTSGWGVPLQLETTTLPLDPVQYNQYLILRVDHFDMRNDAGELFRCPFRPGTADLSERAGACSPQYTEKAD